MAGWRAVMLLTAALCAAALALVVALYREAPHAATPTEAAAVAALPPAPQLLPTLAASVMWGNLNLALVLFFSFAPATEAELGLPAVTAAAWTGAALWIVMFSVPLGGLAVQRLGRADAAIVLFGLLAGLALALLPAGIAPVALGAVFGIAIGPTAGPTLALPARVLGAEHRAGGYGIFYTGYYVIMAAGPAVAGILRQTAGTPAAAMLFAGTLMISLVPLLGLFSVLARPPAVAEGEAQPKSTTS